MIGHRLEHPTPKSLDNYEHSEGSIANEEQLILSSLASDLDSEGAAGACSGGAPRS